MFFLIICRYINSQLISLIAHVREIENKFENLGLLDMSDPIQLGAFQRTIMLLCESIIYIYIYIFTM